MFSFLLAFSGLSPGGRADAAIPTDDESRPQDYLDRGPQYRPRLRNNVAAVLVRVVPLLPHTLRRGLDDSASVTRTGLFLCAGNLIFFGGRDRTARLHCPVVGLCAGRVGLPAATGWQTETLTA